MTKTSIVVVAVLSLAAFGCKKKDGDCTKAIANSMEVAKASMAGVDKAMVARMHDVAVKSCQDDKWSDEVITCMTDAKSETAAQGCYGKLTADQQAKMNKAAMDPPAAGSGSAAGSADSAGSAAPVGSGSAAASGSDAAGSAAPKAM